MVGANGTTASAGNDPQRQALLAELKQLREERERKRQRRANRKSWFRPKKTKRTTPARAFSLQGFAAPTGLGPIVEATGLKKTYGSGDHAVQVLRGVDLTIRQGEILAIMGSSGCGKTTLLNCLSGLDEFDEGRVRVEGTDLAQLSDRERSRHRARRMGFVFQSFNLLPVLSAIQNVEMPLLLLGTNRAEARIRALAALQSVGLKDRAEHKPSELSGGQQQRVAIARALVNQPAIVWADEPTGNLDAENGRQVLDLLRELNRQHRVTLVIVTHDNNVAAAAHRIIRMDDGRITSSTSTMSPLLGVTR